MKTLVLQALPRSDQPRSGRAVPLYRQWICLIALAVAARYLVYWIAAQSYGGAAMMCQWDCGWYSGVIVDGYTSLPHAIRGSYDQANWAFFPAYAFTARAFMLFGLLAPDQAGVLVSVLSTFGFLALGVAYLRETRGPGSGALFVALALSFPYGLYYSFAYTESFFLLWSIAVLYFLTRRPYASAACSAVLTSSRAAGIVFVPLIMMERLLHGWRTWRREGGGTARFLALLPDVALPIAIAPLGLFAFMALLHAQVGDALAFSHIQVAWNRSFSHALGRIWLAIRHPDFHVLPSVSSTLNLMIGLFGLAVGVGLAMRRRFSEAWLCLAAILLPMMTGLESLPRFVAGSAPFLFGLTDWVGRLPSAWMRAAIVVAFFAVQAILLHYWFASAHFLT